MTPNRIIAGAFSLVVFFPSEAIACSPKPGVDHEAWLRAIALPGQACTGISLAAAIAWIAISREPNTRRSIILLGLGLLNPGWLLWGGGDCGITAMLIGGPMAILSLCILGRGLWLRHAARQATTTTEAL